MALRASYSLSCRISSTEPACIATTSFARCASVADLYTNTAVVPSQRLGPGNTPVDIVEATAVTHPHDVMFSVQVDKKPGWKDALAAAARAEAAELESAFDL